MSPGLGVWARAVHRTLAYSRMVGFSHSLLVLPFALAAVALARSTSSQPVSWACVLWVAAAALSCRSAALGFNRVADRDWDRLNPRTRHWELPRGLLSPGTTLMFVMLSAALFMAAMGALGLKCLFLSPVVLSLAFFHALTKRFTWTSHLFLGLVYSLAPIAAWIAVRGALHPPVLVLAALMAAWGAGFDVIYACQDHAFDREWGLFSIPQRFGIPTAMWIARTLHALCLAGMLALKVVFGLNGFYLFGVCLVAAFLVWGHWALHARPGFALRRAFFDTSGLVSIFYFVSVAGGLPPAVPGA